MLEGQWSGMVWPTSSVAEHDPATGVDRAILDKVGKASVVVPEGFVSLCNRSVVIMKLILTLYVCRNFTRSYKDT